MSTTLSFTQSDPVPIPHASDQFSYKELIKQLASQAPTPYGAIPPLLKKRKARKKKQLEAQLKNASKQRTPVRRMSHVENWVAVDSKESLPDEEELVRSSPFLNFLSADFLTQVLPLHMPPPSLSDPSAFDQQGELLSFMQRDHSMRDSPNRDALAPMPVPRMDKRLQEVQTADEALEEEEDDDEDDEDEDDDEEDDGEDDDMARSLNPARTRRGRRRRSSWKSEGEDEEDEENEETTRRKSLIGRRSIPSFSNAQTPSTSTTTSYAMSSSPPHHMETHRAKWSQTIAQLRRSLVQSTSPPTPPPSSSSSSKKDGFIPMPPPPRRRSTSKRRRSEATTQPRFNPDTNTYTRDTRSNPDHLRMISAELNMMRAHKLFSPLKPRGFLPRRKDAFVRGAGRRQSRLRFEDASETDDLRRKNELVRVPL
ncbi:uncharacterized protein BYT42DRAFT_589567 [Radiomyces spectabilis]|uniref:uncharacterized protein n=1 Tax=Radiomyces spectabilis TaxID=64574 RepID=UPI002220C16C|nr:uncharacterized protein BYT42DRAFT_589567 [Radiomyces spectabilis]KAI8365332.1 hypothetical protein BYT42DRAFT_589567 [Radiomyces spectabilis]